ncbi:hypothetical protein CLOSCI_00353 [[Clostridium] scindens ATCC 35704]|nr:hypothetical protein CLOSCI_00353 [[Clostridium] scindens ATCC 35704]
MVLEDGQGRRGAGWHPVIPRPAPLRSQLPKFSQKHLYFFTESSNICITLIIQKNLLYLTYQFNSLQKDKGKGKKKR